MKKQKWCWLPLMGLALLLASPLVACASEPEAVYAPDFTLPTLDGESVTLSGLRGKPVMLTFWTTHCPACMFQAPFVQALYDKSSSEEVAVLTVAVGESATSVQNFVTSHGLTYPVLIDTQGRVAQAYGIPGVPTTFFVDAEGIVKAYKIGPFQGQDQIRSVVESL